jgi:hypothetical protein
MSSSKTETTICRHDDVETVACEGKLDLMVCHDCHMEFRDICEHKEDGSRALRLG